MTSDKGTLWKLGITLVLAVVVMAAIGAYFRPARSGNKFTSNNTSIAVLPFADMSPAKDQEYFSDGLAEQLINDLAKVSGLKVVGRSSAFQFKDKNGDLRDGSSAWPMFLREVCAARATMCESQWN